MRRIISLLLLIATIVVMPTMLTSCGDDEPDIPDTPENPANEQLVLDEESLIGTWRYTASDYANTDYIAFNGRGTGMMALAADQFSNSGQARDDEGAFELVTFNYTIENNIIHIMPDRNHIKDFIITVFDVQRASLDLLFDLDIPARRKTMKLYKDDWEWFTKEGPASVDLTGSFPGNYVVDNDPIHKIQITRINNYTLTIKDVYMNTEVTGVLFWSEIFGTNTSGQITLWKPNDSMGAGYWFTSDGKLHSMAGSHYFSGGASKSDDGSSQGDQNGEQKIDPIGFVGSWYSPRGLSVDTYQSNGTGTRYFLTEAYGDTYSESYDFTWAYVDDIKLLRIYYTDRNSYANENVVSADFPDSFTTQRGKWTKCNTLPKEESNNDASKLYGTWVGKDYDETYTITFYSDGKAKEVWTDGYDSETMNGTYEFSDGKITSWNMSNGSILANVLGDCPWPVTFNSANSITLGSGVNKMTFTKK